MFSGVLRAEEEYQDLSLDKKMKGIVIKETFGQIFLL